MAANEEECQNSGPPAKHRKARPSRARGLRATTGCLTCRSRRIKCDEAQPRCGQCTKSDRECSYRPLTGSSTTAANSHDGEEELPTQRGDSSTTPRLVASSDAAGSNDHVVEAITTIAAELNDAVSRSSFLQPAESRPLLRVPSLSNTPNPQEVAGVLRSDSLVFDEGAFNGECSVTDFETSPRLYLSALSPSSAPFHWYDLLAQDALNNFEKHSFLNQNLDLNFNPQSLSRRASVAPASFPPIAAIQANQNPFPNGTFPSADDFDASVLEPWNQSEPITLEAGEHFYFQHYVQVVAPILDLFDPAKHFGTVVPHLALRNEGLLKSVLAVAARHISLSIKDQHIITPLEAPFDSRSSSFSGGPSFNYRITATQYYYETLGYLSRAMQYTSYTRSSEICATAILISMYEMIDGSSKEWDRHLRGSFWIQRTQDNDGESRGLRKAVWWQWVRQDIWAAFRERRKTLTIWRPKKALTQLTADELATRVVFLQAKAICYVSDEAMKSTDISKRIEEGDALLKALQDWYEVLPMSYRPLPMPYVGSEALVFTPMWIHPPAWAAAIQTFCFAKIVVLLNKPYAGGSRQYHQRQNMLLDCVKLICGLAQSPHATELPSAFVSFQCLYAAGQVVRNVEQQHAIVELLEKTLDTIKFPSNTLADDLRTLWSGND